MGEGQTTAAVQHYLDALASDQTAEPIVRALLGQATARLQSLAANLLYRSYPRLARPPLNLQHDELLSAVVERLLKAMRTVRPGNVRQFFALANQHMRWELNDLARRLDEQPREIALVDRAVEPPVSAVTGPSPNMSRMLQAIESLPEDEREVFSLVRIQGMTHGEAAAVVDVSPKTVQRRLNRALLLLAESLGDLGTIEPDVIDETRVRQLLEEALDSGLQPEDVCVDSPELLAAVRERWLRVRALDAEVESLFPTPGRLDARPSSQPIEPPQMEGYAVEAEIGRGGVGVVYKARHLRLGRTVAVKMLLAGEYALPEQLERFAREAEVVAQLRHPNIVQVFDVGDHERRPFFTMEYIEGGSLAQKLGGTPQPAREAAAMLATLADAMEVAHNGGVVHRDLKPANILLDRHGTPKISDFGLARRLDGSAGLTLSGAAVGTPSYMAPEQALGKERLIGPATDIYSLGAMLYETLTGRPPFRAETSAETERQVIHEEPVRPSRLNARVPRDLETICLKCLNKNPERRYASAAAFADDLRRYLRGEPITARPTGMIERLTKWVRRRPSLAAAMSGAALSLLALIATILWLGLQRSSTKHAVNEDLRVAAVAQQASNWVEARTALERAKARIGGGGLDELRERCADIDRELDLVARLEGIRLQRAAVVEGRFDARTNQARADREYETALSEYGMRIGVDDAESVASRVRASNICAALVAALDDWAICSSARDDEVRLAWILDAARQSDSDPTGWRAQVREPATWKDKDALGALAHAALTTAESTSGTSLPCLMALAQRLADAGGDSIPLLRQLQREHPADFWANLALGDALRAVEHAEAVRYYQAALSLRPDAEVVRNNLGHALALGGRIDEALDQFRKALRSDPSFGQAQANLGNTLSIAGRETEAIEAYSRAMELEPTSGLIRANIAKSLATLNRLDEALDYAQQAIVLEPTFVTGYINLGFVLKLMGRNDEAIEQYTKAIALDPSPPGAHFNLGFALVAVGRLDEAVAEFENALRLDPKSAVAHCGLSTAWRMLGRLDKAIAHGETAVQLDPDGAGSHNDLGIALAMSGRADEAMEHVRRAVSIDPDHIDARNNLGNLYGLNGQFEEAIEQYRESLRLEPDSAQANGALGQAFLYLGRLSEARDALRRGLALYPENGPQHAECAQQLQLCEQLIELEPRMLAVLKSRNAPQSGAECLQFALLCRMQGRFAQAAWLCERAFVIEPALGENLDTSERFHAACAAALAGSQRDVNAANVDDDERAHWRKRAREWLRADLALSDARIGESEQVRMAIGTMLSHWLKDAAVASLRDEQKLAQLPEIEQEDCRALWRDVEALLARAREPR